MHAFCHAPKLPSEGEFFIEKLGRGMYTWRRCHLCGIYAPHDVFRSDLLQFVPTVSYVLALLVCSVCTGGSRGPWRPEPQKFRFFQNHAVFRQFKGKTPILSKFWVQGPPLGSKLSPPPPKSWIRPWCAHVLIHRHEWCCRPSMCCCHHPVFGSFSQQRVRVHKKRTYITASSFCSTQIYSLLCTGIIWTLESNIKTKPSVLWQHSSLYRCHLGGLLALHAWQNLENRNPHREWRPALNRDV